MTTMLKALTDIPAHIEVTWVGQQPFNYLVSMTLSQFKFDIYFFIFNPTALETLSFYETKYKIDNPCGRYYKTNMIINDDHKWHHNLEHHLQS
jgi:hypothetical protein